MIAAPIEVNHLGKRYRYYGRRRPRSWRTLFAPTDRKRTRSFWALRDISFAVHPGETLGVIGANGAGKSTLLRLLGGIGRPDEGEVKVRGRIGALLDLGGGFLNDLTGYENATLAAVVAGLTRREAAERMPAIVDFAELLSFMNEPLHTFSSGMSMRLAFAVAVHTDPTVLLVDEFLSVGDLAFQAKCLTRIEELRRKGCAVVVVAHGMDQIRQLCDRALWLREGQVAAFDAAEVVAGAYEVEMRAETKRRTPEAVGPKQLENGIELRMNDNRFGSLEVEITQLKLRPENELHSGDPLFVEIEFFSKKLIQAPIFTVSITREDGTVCLDTNTESALLTFSEVEGAGAILFEVNRLDLSAGSYFVNAGIYERGWNYAYDYHWHAYPLIVHGSSAHRGIIAPRCYWSASTAKYPSAGYSQVVSEHV